MASILGDSSKSWKEKNRPPKYLESEVGEMNDN